MLSLVFIFVAVKLGSDVNYCAFCDVSTEACRMRQVVRFHVTSIWNDVTVISRPLTFSLGYWRSNEIVAV